MNHTGQKSQTGRKKSGAGRRALKAAAGAGCAGAALYLGAIAPRLYHQPQGIAQAFYAHRGLHDNAGCAPENTMPAFRAAVEHGYGIELDVQLTRDGKVVVAHDFTLRRICGVDRAIDSLTFEELKQYPIFGSEETVPLFTDVLRLVDGRVPLIVELKYKGKKNVLCEKTDAILRRYRGRYCIESFRGEVLLWYRLHHPEVCRGQLSCNFQREDGMKTASAYALRHLLFNFLTKPDFIAYDHRDRHAVSLNLCHSLFHCQTVAWTIRSRSELCECRPQFDYFIFEGFLP